MAPEKYANRIKLKDGRRLGFAEFGDSNGCPVLFFHGWIGSRLDFQPNDQAAKSAKARVFAIDCPGCGLCDFKPGRNIIDWADDVAELADELGLGSFAVLGHSFGGPFILSYAYKIPDRVTKAGIIAGISPLNRPGATDGMATGVRLGLWMAGHAPMILLSPIFGRYSGWLIVPD